MQHHLIGELNLGSGEADGEHHAGTNELYSNIAYHTSIPSVHNALKTRNDTQTPEIQQAIKENKHGLDRQRTLF